MTTISKKKTLPFRLNMVSRKTESLFHLILGLFALACIIPFVFVIIISFSSEDSIRQIGYSFTPNAWAVDAYRQVFNLGDALWRSYFNSFFITVLGTVLSVTMCVLYAYPLFRKDYKYRRFFSFLSFFTMIFGGGLIPTYIVCKNLLGMSNNYAALIVPMLVSPFNIIIMRTFFQTSVPFDLIEAEQELTAGYQTEYSGMGFAMFYLAEYVNMVIQAALVSTFFLGGFLPLQIGIAPVDGILAAIPGIVWMVAKILLVVFVYMWFRWSFPRPRIDQLLALEWKTLVPANLVLFALGVLLVSQGWIL